MPISRSGPTPQFHDYICKWVLVDPNGQVPEHLQSLLGMVNTLKIPTFQRGISWGKDEVIALLDSDSILYGNVIIGMFEGRPGELVDGLQRFATGTVLLQLFYDRVLSPQPCKPDASPYFLSLKAIVGGLQPVFSNNHNQLLNHPRGAIQRQYNLLFNELNRVFDDFLNNKNVKSFAKQVNTAFLEKQVAIDEYFGFTNSIHLVNTFIGLNTVRLELSSVDLIRAIIIERASSCAPPWENADIEQSENDITDTFTENGAASGAPKRDLLPTATVILKCLQGKDGLRSTDVFPNWNTFDKKSLNKLLDFLDQIVATKNSYVCEIKEAGSLPFAIVVLFYYRQFLQTGSKPAFLTKSSSENDQELNRFLCAVYRALIEGVVGRLGDIAENVLKNNYETLDTVADDVAKITRSGSLDNPPPKDWLKANLAAVDSKKARRVFNACLLPERANRGQLFSPKIFSRKSKDWQIDHLIPQKLLTKNQSSYSAKLDDQSLLEPNAVPNIGEERINAIMELLIPRL